MTRRARRLLYLLAFAIFFTAAPIVVLTTAGYHWSGHGTTWELTGVIGIASTPRATVLLNGQIQGQTPKRLANLRPGIYEVTLRRDGYSSWTRLVRVEAKTATLLGPVVLLPPSLSVAPLPSPPADEWRLDDRQGVLVALIHPAPTTTIIRAAWPPTVHVSGSLPWAPDWLRVSPKHQLWLFGHGTEMAVLTTNASTHPWIVPAVDDPVWASISEQVFYGLLNGQVQRYDYLAQTITPLAAATSATTSQDTLWFTRTSANQTTLWRLSLTSAAESMSVATLDGAYNWLNEIPNTLLLRNQSTQSVAWLQFDSVTKQLSSTPLGAVDHVLIHDGQQWVWQGGSGLFALLDRRPVLLDRPTQKITAAGWVASEHVLALADQASFRIASISSRQGRGVLVQKDLSVSQQVLLVDPAQSLAVVADTSSHQLWTWGWRRN